MAPNLAGVGVPVSESLDSYLARHNSHESMELDRDEKQESIVSELVFLESVIPSVMKSSEGGDLVPARSPSISPPASAAVAVAANRPPQKVAAVVGATDEAKSVVGKSLTSAARRRHEGAALDNFPWLNSKSTDDTDNKKKNSETMAGVFDDGAVNDPEESLLQHDEAVQASFRHRQDDLLEQALKETKSVLREEEEWAVAEKRHAEDLSFVQTVEDALQLATTSNDGGGDGNIAVVRSDGKFKTIEPLTEFIAKIDYVRPIENDDHVKFPPVVELDANVATSSGSPPLATHLSEPQTTHLSSTMKPILTKRTKAPSSRKLVVEPSNVSQMPAKVVINNADLQIQTTSKSSGQVHIQLEKSKPRLNFDSNDSRTETQPRRGSASSRDGSTSSSHGSASASTVEPIVGPTHYSDGGILHIPGHEPETPANILLTHHEHSKQFLERQGARVLNENMSAEGATAIILSSVCLLFIALIGMGYFFRKQRHLKLKEKVAADAENQREKYLTSDSFVTYKLQPPPKTSFSTVQIFSENSQNQSKPLFVESLEGKQTNKATDKISGEELNMDTKISEKLKMAASGKESIKMAATHNSNPSSIESLTQVRFSPTLNYSRGKLWFTISYDSLQEALLLHLQQARFPEVRPAGPVWVEACLLTAANDVHTLARSDVTTATQSPVFNSRLAFKVAMGHLSNNVGLLLRLTLCFGDNKSTDLTTAGSVILPITATQLLTNTGPARYIRDLH